MGDAQDGVRPQMTVFVTVGTTCFDALVRAVDTREVQQELSARGYTHLVIQMGRGTYIPKKSDGEDGSLVVDYFAFSSSIADYLRSASLVISHAACWRDKLAAFAICKAPKGWDYVEAGNLNFVSHAAGSGSIFETLRLGKPLIVVVNEDLMDNHQSELAEELAERKHLYCSRPQTLYKTLADMDLESLLPYVSGDATPVAKLINRFLGFPDD